MAEIYCSLDVNHQSINQSILLHLQVYGSPDSIKVEGQKEPGKQTTFMVYPDATPEQINVLTKQSGFCSQVRPFKTHKNCHYPYYLISEKGC